MNKTYAYIRVSSKEQNENRQIDAIASYNIPKKQVFIDKISGKDFNRPQYLKLVRHLKKGDLLILKSIDRLGRNYEDVLEQWKIITKQKGVDIKIIDMPLLDTTMSKDLLGTFIADLVLQLLSFVAENERSNIKQQQAEGIAAAKARGIQFGRPKIKTDSSFYKLYADWTETKINAKEAAKQLNMSTSTFYRRINEHKSRLKNYSF